MSSIFECFEQICYVAPEAEVVDMQSECVLCASDGYTVTNPFGGNSEQEW